MVAFRNNRIYPAGIAPLPLVLPAFFRQLEVDTWWRSGKRVSFAGLLRYLQWIRMDVPLNEMLVVLDGFRDGLLGAFEVDTWVESPDGKETGLFLAVYEGKPTVAEWFLENGADPTIEPVRSEGKFPARYITTHLLKRAMKNAMPFSLIDKLLARGASTEPTKDAFYRKNIFEFVMVDCRMLHTDFMVGYMKCLLSGSTAVPSAYVVDTLYWASQLGSTVYPANILHEILGPLMWRADRDKIMANRIQRYWLSFKLKKAVICVQRRFREKVWHPDHVWNNGKTTVARLFAGRVA